jgi:hypothetical protein
MGFAAGLEMAQRLNSHLPAGNSPENDCRLELRSSHNHRTMGGLLTMADDRMKNDDQRNMGNKEGQDFGQQSPGRGHEQGGKHTGGQQDEGQYSGQRDSRNLDEDEETGTHQSGGKNRGGQNR